MLTLQNIVEAGYNVQLRREQVIEYSDILDVENLDIKDLINGNYDYEDVVDLDYSQSSKRIWIEKDGIGKVMKPEDLELVLSDSDNINDFQKKLIDLNTIL